MSDDLMQPEPATGYAPPTPVKPPDDYAPEPGKPMTAAEALAGVTVPAGNVPPDDPGEYQPTDASHEARMLWPYLVQPGGLRNGRETGAWIAGHLFGRAMHGERGLRVQLDTGLVDGAVTVLVAAGIAVQHYSSEGSYETLDCWL